MKPLNKIIYKILLIGLVLGLSRANGAYANVAEKIVYSWNGKSPPVPHQLIADILEEKGAKVFNWIIWIRH